MHHNGLCKYLFPLLSSFLLVFFSSFSVLSSAFLPPFFLSFFTLNSLNPWSLTFLPTFFLWLNPPTFPIGTNPCNVWRLFIHSSTFLLSHSFFSLSLFLLLPISLHVIMNVWTIRKAKLIQFLQKRKTQICFSHNFVSLLVLWVKNWIGLWMGKKGRRVEKGI